VHEEEDEDVDGEDAIKLGTKTGVMSLAKPTFTSHLSRHCHLLSSIRCPLVALSLAAIVIL
jgi:hypothetical protein